MLQGDAIIETFLPRALAPVRRSAEMWRPVQRYLHNRRGDGVDETVGETIFEAMSA